MKLGVLDIGTNSIHIVIAEVDKDGSFEIVGRAKDMTRLGDGTLKSGLIPRDKLERATAVVKHFVQLARNRGVSRIIGVATAAVREAANGGEFIDRVQEATGVKIRTVTGEEEARLIALAVRHFSDLSREPALLVDIGGGSVELIVATARDIPFVRSLKLGGARLKDLFITDTPVPKSDHERIHRHVSDSIAPTVEEIRRFGVKRAIGSSGTLINLGSVISGLREDRPLTMPHGFTFDRAELEEVHKVLARADEETYEGLKGLDPQRQDILLPGACFLLEVVEALDIDSITLCDKAIREGLILDYASKNARRIALEAEVPNVRLRSVLQLLSRFEADEPHARQTARLALQLFDQLPPPKPLRPGARELLEYGALLHDVGYHVSFESHHKHGWYLIKNSELAGFSPEEVDIIACIARYHRRRGPKKDDACLEGLDKTDRRTVGYLSAVVRVADALDRSHFGVVEQVRVSSRGRGQLVLRVTGRDDPAMELWAAHQKTGLLEKLTGRAILLEGSRRGDTARAARTPPVASPADPAARRRAPGEPRGIESPS